MKNKKRILVLSLALVVLFGAANVYAGTSWSSYKTVTVKRFGSGWPAHPSQQKKSAQNKAGKVDVDYVGGNYMIYARMTGKTPEGYWMIDGAKVEVSTGDRRALPSVGKKGSDVRCYFNSKLTTYVNVNCRSRWYSN